MNSVAIAAAIMAGLGTLLAIILATAYKFLKVYEDPRIDEVEAMLPGSNCGACGQPGCRAFAEKVVGAEEAPSKCTVSSPDGIAAIAAYLGVEAGEQVKRVARLACAGGSKTALQMAAYAGFSSCRAAALVSGGGKGCAWGCIGLGDCATSCGFDAIHMNDRNLPLVTVDKCTACGDCVDACPKDLFSIVRIDQPLFVQCNTPLSGEDATSVCTVACDGCGRCAADAPVGLIKMVDNLPLINRNAFVTWTPDPTKRCPTGAIQWVEGNQFQGDEPTSIDWRRSARLG